MKKKTGKMEKLNQPDYVVRINREFVSPGEACVSIFDHGFLYGDSIFEVVRTSRGKIVSWDGHLIRLKNSASRLSMRIPWSDGELRGEVTAILETAKWKRDSYVRMIITRGEGLIDLAPDSCESPNLFVIGKELPIFPPDFYEKGITLCLTEVRRNSRLAMDPAIKSGNYLNNVMAIIESRQKGANDALMLNEEGYVTESTTSNFYLVKGGKIYTPPLESGILAGITRDTVFTLCRDNGIEIGSRDIRIEDVAGADEMFITGTVKGVMPVGRILGIVEWNRGPGPVTLRLRELYEKMLENS